MDIYQALINDHNELKPLLNQLVQATKADEKTKVLLNKIRDALVPHTRAEEAVFYNSLRQIDSVKTLVVDSYKEHMEAEVMLRTLQAMDTVGIEWTKLALKFKNGIEHHIAEEQGPLFDAARKVLLDYEAQQMAVAFEKLKPEIKEKGFVRNTMDLVANLMPKRFADKFRSFEIPT